MRIERATFAAVLGVLVGVAVLLSAFGARAQDYADAGTYTYRTTDLEAGTAGSIGGSLVVPNEPGTYPLLIASHGWSASSAQQLGWAQHYATYGFVVAVPSFPNTLTPNFTVDQGIIVQLVALYANPATVSPAQGKVDPTKIGLEGHSAGGLATTLAAAQINPNAVVLFDPVDSADAGKAAYADVCSPLLDIFADPSACNNQEEWSTFATDTQAPLVFFRVVGSTHCDGENVDRGAACGLVCGGAADPVRQAVYAKYATAFFLAQLKGDTTAAAALTQTALAADTAITIATVQAGQPCSVFNDGGAVVTSDGGVGSGDPGNPGSSDDGGALGTSPGGGSSGGSDDGGSAGGGNGAGGSSGGGASGGGPTGATSGCGCSFVGAQPAGSAVGLFVAVIALARRKRQRRG